MIDQRCKPNAMSHEPIDKQLVILCHCYYEYQEASALKIASVIV